ncbi:Inhibitor of growth protein 5 [Wickerhamiella sorbophila]|uniref:Inhibitor of growth protein 5 n=1 Tax=Wickerhamiella sorbophila TaxID=45607 RepID=A0A2T0FE44_9ASCO|nr:Inhibitor of growth protein 5 [Wickerhamiella sorbophila]PRT53278.1 Inhibitor of growth protein 5 [Wickerhamiella sorbophila]
MHHEVARSVQLIENLDPAGSQIAEMLGQASDSFVKSSFRPAETDSADNANAVAEADHLISFLTARIDFLNRLVPKNTRRPPKNTEPVYCKCRKPAFGEMVGCDDPDCPYEWYHMACVDITVAPKGKWFCPTCRERIGLKSPKKRQLY